MVRKRNWLGFALVAGSGVLLWVAGGTPARAQVRGSGLPPVTAKQRAAAFPDVGGVDVFHSMPNNPYESYVLFDQLEHQDSNNVGTLSWDITAYTGRNFNRIWARSEGERRGGNTESAELQVLYGHSIAPWWDLVAGVREDFQPAPSRGWAAFGIQGLAPYRFDLEATMFAGNGGKSAARVKAEYEFLITEELVLQPHVELNWYGQNDPRYGLGAGFATAEVGLRLRYEIRRRVAPYIGLVRESKHGATARFARAAGETPEDTRLVVGVRFWF